MAVRPRQVNAETLKAILEKEAKQGNRIVNEKKNIWAGLGNRAGLHSYLSECLSEKWTKSGLRFLMKVDKLAVAGTHFVVQEFRNIDRLRGRWIEVMDLEVI